MSISASTREELLRTHAAHAARRMVRAGETMARRQITRGPGRGNLPPWAGSTDADFHGTLQGIWLWSRATTLSGEERFTGAITAAWTFVEAQWRRFIPNSLGASAGDEAAYDCAMVLRAALASRHVEGGDALRLAEPAARLLAAHLADRDDSGGRDFRDPGFLAWSLLDWAQATEDRGLQSSGRRYVEKAFGMKAPAAFEKEPTGEGGLFDFSSTSAMRVMAVLSAEGPTPFVGAWLRERVGVLVPKAFVLRPLDENPWNACVAAAMGRAFRVSTDPVFLDGYNTLLKELFSRAEECDGGLGRKPGFGAESCATFYYGLALDAPVSA